MLWIAMAAAVLAGSEAPSAPDARLREGLSGALRGCETWILDPATWSNGFGPYLGKVGLGPSMARVSSADPAALPPPALRKANIFWRINSTPTAGYMLVVSDRLPMCHITGGGDADLQPVVEDMLQGAEFTSRWKARGVRSTGDMVSSTFQSVEEPNLMLVVSRAAAAGGRRDRVQVIITGLFDLSR